jgi:glyoxylase-like metal-dependent hydrolase (beta-lactamase superfamily II)
MPYFRQIPAPAEHAFSYLLADSDKREAVLIDPLAGQAPLYLGLLDEIQARLTRVLLTHAHQPRLPGCEQLCAASGALLCASGASGVVGLDRVLADGDVVPFGNELLRVWQTPGHTPGCLSYLWRDRVFCGDALLIGDCGSTDEAGSDPGALFDSLTRRLFTLPDETLVYPAHDHAGRCVSCIGEQRYTNPRLTGATRDEFISARRAVSNALSPFSPSLEPRP